MNPIFDEMKFSGRAHTSAAVWGIVDEKGVRLDEVKWKLMEGLNQLNEYVL